MRKLASIQRISDLTPIDGADAIEVATILGWKVVVKKGEFRVGDLCVYCEIDSILPDKPEFEFLKDRGYRIKTIKLRGQVSQGIAFPTWIIPGAPIPTIFDDILGLDVTEALGVTKYDPPEISEGGFKLGYTKGNFPSYVAKTDETRIQSLPHLLEEIKGIPFYISEKVDGTSGTFGIMNGEIDICSRNLSKKETEPGTCVYWDVARKYGLIDILKKYDNIVIQGEVAGPGIQKNKLGLKEVQFFAFNVYDVKKGEYFSFEEFKAFCEENKIQTVPILETNVLLDNETVESLLVRAEGKYPSGKEREGIVLRPMKERQSRVLKGRMSFKVINNRFLLKAE